MAKLVSTSSTLGEKGGNFVLPRAMKKLGVCVGCLEILNLMEIYNVEKGIGVWSTS